MLAHFFWGSLKSQTNPSNKTFYDHFSYPEANFVSTLINIIAIAFTISRNE